MLRVPRIFTTGCFLATVISATSGVSAQSAAPAVKTVNVNGFTLEYLEDGQGTPVVFLHGATGALTTFETQRKDFASTYRFISYSRRYHAPGAWPDEGASYTFAQHLADVPAFIRALNLGKVHLVGWSYGARLAVHAALKNPELFLSVTALEPGMSELAPKTPAAQAVLAAANRQAAAERAMVAKNGPQSITLSRIGRITDDPLFPEKLPADYVALAESQSRIIPLGLKDGSSTTPQASCEQLKTLSVPLLLARSERSSASAAMVHEGMETCLGRSSEAVIIPNTNHWFFHTNPAAVSSTVRAFVGKHNAGTVPTRADATRSQR